MKTHIAKTPVHIIIAILFSTVFVAAIVQDYTKSQTFNNEFETAGVKVKIDQLNIKNEVVLPGSKISYAPKVTNLEAESYVRVKFDMHLGNKKEIEASPNTFLGIKDGWIVKYNYLYFTQTLKTGEVQEVFDGIRVPYSAEQEADTLSIIANVEGIQASNFSPDFNSANPWGDVEIQSTPRRAGVAGKQLIVAASVANQATSGLDFTYAHEGTFECSTEDLFSKFESFQPGDICKEYLNMKNESNKEMEIHFKTENKRTDLLDEMKLNVICCGEEVYNGSLTSQQLKQFMSIGTIPGGQSGKFEFEISMPKSADNSFAELKDNVTWIIAVNEIEGDKEAKTGDEIIPIAIMFLALTVSLLVAVIVVYKRVCGKSPTSRKRD